MAVTLRGEAPRHLPINITVALFRIAQEALRNAARHSGASSATVEIAAADGELRVTVEDRGRGFDPEAASAAGAGPAGLGLACMRERLTPFGGRCIIESAPARGTRIQAFVPLSLCKRTAVKTSHPRYARRGACVHLSPGFRLGVYEVIAPSRPAAWAKSIGRAT